MKTEKVITLQAKERLKGNWITVIASFVFICAVLLCLNCLQSIALLALDTVNYDSGEFRYGTELPVFLSNLALFAAILLVSPLLNGFLKICYEISQGINTQISRLFYCFKSFKLYFKTLFLDLIPLIITFLCVSVYDIFTSFLSQSYIYLQIEDNFGIIGLNIAMLLTDLALAFVFVLIVFLFMHYPLFLYADDCSGSIVFYYSKGIYIAVKHFKSTLKLFFRFIGWILLCFFVVPAFYVLPYYAVSFAVSAKWLISLEKGRNLQ